MACWARGPACHRVRRIGKSCRGCDRLVVAGSAPPPVRGARGPAAGVGTVATMDHCPIGAVRQSLGMIRPVWYVTVSQGGNVIAAVCVFSVCMQWVCVISMLHCAGLPDRIFYVGSGFPAYTTACTLLNNTVKARYYEFIC